MLKYIPAMKFKPLLSLFLLLSMDFCSVSRPRLVAEQPSDRPATVRSATVPPSVVAAQKEAEPDRTAPVNRSPQWGDGPFVQEGVASWYGPDFHGKATSNGEVYDQSKLTAAHQTLPFHTLVEVENLENGRKVLVRVNDRGPFLKNRIIDLSNHAARQIGMLENGTAPVRLRVVRPILDQVSRSPVYRVGYFLQLGAFTDPANAEFLLGKLQATFPEESFLTSRDGDLTKVVTLSYDDKEEIQALQERLRQRGFDFFVKESAGTKP